MLIKSEDIKIEYKHKIKINTLSSSKHNSSQRD
jgi:hypothetical protein